jgi:general secretion pathway protein D
VRLSAWTVREYVAALLVLFLAQGPIAWAQEPQMPPTPPGFGPRQSSTRPAETPQANQLQTPAPAAAPAQPAKPALGPDSANIPLGGLNLQNVSLIEVVDYLARLLKINYILDKRVSGSVTINTYGEVKNIEPRALLDTILRINGAAMVQTGDLYRIVPLVDVARLPLKPSVDEKPAVEDERAMLNLIFLKYASVEELTKLLSEFIGEGARLWAYQPANLLLVLDTRRNISRLMDLVSMFDSDVLAHQRVRLFEMQYSKPSDISKELEGLLKSMSLSKELTTIRFIPVDRINTLIAVAPNPGAFKEVETWLAKLDVKQKVATGATNNYVYRVKYGVAMALAGAITMLYGGMPAYGSGYGGANGFGGIGGANAMFGASYGGGMSGMGYGGMGYGGMGMGGGMGYGGMGVGGMGYGGMGYGGMGMAGGGMGYGGMGIQQAPVQGGGGVNGLTANPMGGAGGDMTGSYVGNSQGFWGNFKGPRVVPNPFDNTLIIQSTPQEYESILSLLKDLDVPPRQVLIEAKIYEVELSGAFSNGVEAYFRSKGSNFGGRPFPGTSVAAGLTDTATGIATMGTVIGASKELLVFLNTQEVVNRSRVLSAPSIIATDSIPATINVGVDVPTLTSQAVTGATSGGSSVFANTVSNRSTGVTLNITARISPSGIVTLFINQEVSAPGPPPTGGIQSPSFNRKSVQTQVTLQDGDTIAIGGIISENSGISQKGIPGLIRIPYIGWIFGQVATNKARNELIIFMTPRVIYDTNELRDASEELKSRMRKLQPYVKE